MARTVLINAISVGQGGGARSYAINLLRELNRDARGFRFTVLAAQGQLDASAVGQLELQEIRLPQRGRTLARVGYEQALLPLRARRFDLVYCLADLMPLWGATPVVGALRNLNIYDRRFYDTPRTRLLFRLVRRGARRARGLVTPSHAAARNIAAALGVEESRITVVPHGISTEAFAGNLEAAQSTAPYVFLAANLERHKNLETLFASLRYVADASLQVWVAGGRVLDPEWAEHLEEVIEQLGMRDRVRLLGAVPYREVLAYYKGATALVFPSRLETFGHPLLEAMLAETPMVASDIPAFHEVAGDAALYFEPDDVEGLARCIDSVVADPAATRGRVERGKRRAARFTWERSVDGLCQVFDRVAEQGAS